MNGVAIKMLFGDPVKLIGLVMGVTFATLLISQQSGIFVGLMLRAANLINEAQEVDLWIMDPGGRYIENVRPMRDTELARVRGVRGVAWAVPYFKGTATVRSPGGSLQTAGVIGVDDATLIGLPRQIILGDRESLRGPDAVLVDRDGYALLFPDQPLQLGNEFELNDRRAVVKAIGVVLTPFSTQPQIFTRYSSALSYTNNGRNQLSFIIARAAGRSPETVASTISAVTGLKALTRAQHVRQTIEYIFRFTGIPISFGAVIGFGILVGAAIVGITFSLFITDNVKQYAALKAMGLPDSRLFRMVLLQAGIIGAIGYGIGLGLAGLFFIFAPPSTASLRDFFLPWWVAVGMAVLVIFIMLVATVFSLNRVLRIDPAIVFRG